MDQMPIEFIIAPRAKAALKGKWPTALLVGFGASILQTLVQVVFTLIFTPAMEKTQVLLEQGYPAEYVINVLVETLLSQATPLAVLAFATAVITPALNLGYHAYSLKLLRGEEGAFGDLFSRMNVFFKALGLNIMTGLRIFLWTMLGVGAFYAVVFAAMFATNFDTNVLGMLSFLVFFAMIPGVMATYRYMIAPYAMADEPEMKINAAIRLSKQLTKKRKMRLFMLIVGWSVMGQFANSLLQLLLGSVVGLALGMMVMLACSVRAEVITASFYLTYRQVDTLGKETIHADETDSRPSVE